MRISTLDNPGWQLKVLLQGTDLEARGFAPIKERYDDPLTWVHCVVEAGEFRGHDGPEQLERLIRIFLDWAHAPPP